MPYQYTAFGKELTDDIIDLVSDDPTCLRCCSLALISPTRRYLILSSFQRRLYVTRFIRCLRLRGIAGVQKSSQVQIQTNESLHRPLHKLSRAETLLLCGVEQFHKSH